MRTLYAGPLYSEWSGVTSDKVTFEQRLKGEVTDVQGWGREIFLAEGVHLAREGMVPRAPGDRVAGAQGTAVTSERKQELRAITGYIKDFAFHSEGQGEP